MCPMQIVRVLWMATLAAQTPGSMTPEEIALANRSAIESLRTASVRVKYYRTESMAGGLGSFLPTDDYVWVYDETHQRLSLDQSGGRTLADGTGDSAYFDAVNGPDGFFSISRCDPRRASIQGEYSLSRAYGVMSDRQVVPNPFNVDPRDHLLLRTRWGVKGWSLTEMIAAARTARVTAGPGSSPRKCYEITAELDDPHVRFSYSVDPAANFLVRRISFEPLAGAKPQARAVMEVTEFKDFGEGVHFPTKVVGELSENGGTLRHRVDCEVRSLNRPIDPEAFRIAFPDWLLVNDVRNGKFHRWGPDGKPRLTFDSLEAYYKWWIPRRSKAERDTAGRRFPWFAVTGGATVVVAIIGIVRGRRRRAGSLKAAAAH